jgi:hypothetical protein
MAGESKRTTDHEVIREWAEMRGAKPATVKGTQKDDPSGVLRLQFPGYGGERLQEISWVEFFSKFDDKQLEFLYQDDRSSGETSHFFRLVKRPARSRSAEQERKAS